MKKILRLLLFSIILLAFPTQTVLAIAPPHPPTNLQAHRISPSEITMSWDPVEYSTEYKVEYIPTGGSFRNLTVLQTQVTLTGLSNLEYRVRVSACNQDGCSISTSLLTVSREVETPPQNNNPAPPPNQPAPAAGQVTTNTIPGLTDIFNQSPVRGKFNNLGEVISTAVQILFYFAVLGTFLMLVVSGARWVFSGGNKETIAKARARITYAIVGLIIFILAYTLTQYIAAIFKPKGSIPFSLNPLVTTVYAAPTVKLGEQYGFGDLNTIGDLITRFVKPLFIVAGVGILFFFILAAFRYIISGGDKETLGKARSSITNAIIGFVILMLSFIILQFLLRALFGINIAKQLFGLTGV